MKTTSKVALVSAVALVAAASARAQTPYNGDLLLGFTAQSGNDFIIDIGAESSLGTSATFNLGSQLSGFNLNTVNWGVVGDKNSAGVRTAWTTTSGSPPAALANATAWGNLDTPTKSIYQNFTTAGAGQTLTITASDDNSWNQQMINGALTTQYHNAYQNPNLTGLGSLSLWGVVANGSAPTLLGTFALDSMGNVTFTATPVPEPSTYGVLAGLGVLAVSLRRQLRFKI